MNRRRNSPTLAPSRGSGRASKRDVSDLRALKRELSDIVGKQRNALRAFAKDLRRAQDRTKSTSKGVLYVRGVLGSVGDDVRQVAAELRDLQAMIANYHAGADISVFFNYIGTRIYPVVRKACSIRYALTRHTPTLRGTPRALHPQQLYSLQKRNSITVDYLRAACLFDVKDTSKGIEWKPNPVVDGSALDLTCIIHGVTHPSSISLSFNGAIGAIRTVRALMEADAFSGPHKKIMAHRKSWLEVSADMLWGNTGRYEFMDETDGRRLLGILSEHDVVGLSIEPIYNHPEMPTTNLGDLLSELAKSRGFKEPKYVLIDSAHTPELNPFAFFKRGRFPKGLCIFNAVSSVKYMQAGWDISKGGVLTMLYDKKTWKWGDPLTRILQFRENMGTGISYEEAALMGIETRRSFVSRMNRYDRNVSMMRKGLGGYFAANAMGRVGSADGGRLLYLIFNGPHAKRSREIYLDILKVAEKNGMPLMDASSFGMCSPHIHFVMHPEVGPIIRVSPGSTNHSTVERLTQLIIEVISNSK